MISVASTLATGVIFSQRKGRSSDWRKTLRIQSYDWGIEFLAAQSLSNFIALFSFSLINIPQQIYLKIKKSNLLVIYAYVPSSFFRVCSRGAV